MTDEVARSRRVRPGVVASGTVVALGAGLLVTVGTWWLEDRRGEPLPYTQARLVDATHLEVDYLGSACRTAAHLETDAQPDRVVVTVRQRVAASACDDVGVPATLRTTLDRPLGDRTVVDGACAFEEFAGYPACAKAVADVGAGS